MSFSVGVGKAEDVARSLWGHGDVSVHRLALRVEHGALDDGLSLYRQGSEGKDGCDEVSVHIFIMGVNRLQKISAASPDEAEGVPIGLVFY